MGSVCLFSREMCCVRGGKQSELILGIDLRNLFLMSRFRRSRHSLKLQEGEKEHLKRNL